MVYSPACRLDFHKAKRLVCLKPRPPSIQHPRTALQNSPQLPEPRRKRDRKLFTAWFQPTIGARQAIDDETQLVGGAACTLVKHGNSGNSCSEKPPSLIAASHRV